MPDISKEERLTVVREVLGDTDEAWCEGVMTEAMTSVQRAKNTIRIYMWQLKSMNEYSSTLPSRTTPFKMWKRNVNDSWVRAQSGLPPTEPLWVVGQYYPVEDPDRIGIRWFDVQLLEGPKPSGWVAPDWSNYDRWKRDYNAERVA